MAKDLLLFDFDDYRAYLADQMGARRTFEKGIQSKLAAAIGCQPAYVSKVLAKGAHLSLEQAERASHFCNHSDDEKHFFMLLVQATRAGTMHLKKYFSLQLEECRRRTRKLDQHMKLERVEDLETQLKYYARWTTAAVHVLLTIPEYRTRPALSAKLGISISEINAALDLLKANGMAEENGGVLTVGNVGLHLGSDSFAIKQHHSNWRLKALDAIARGSADDLHYSSIVSISVSDRERFRNELIHWIAQFREQVTASNEEDAAAICVDFFSL